MNDDILRNLLIDADAMMPAPQTHGRLAERVRQRASQRRIGKVAACLLGAIGVSIAMHMHRTDRHVPGPALAKLETKPIDELTRLNNEAAIHERVVEQLLAVEAQTVSQRKLENSLALSRFVSTVPIERETAAAILVAGGDQLLHTPQGKQAACDQYRSVLRLFPDTHTAKQASERLKQIDSQTNT